MGGCGYFGLYLELRSSKKLKLKFKGPLALLGAQELDKLRFKPKGAPVRIWSLGA